MDGQMEGRKEGTEKGKKRKQFYLGNVLQFFQITKSFIFSGCTSVFPDPDCKSEKTKFTTPHLCYVYSAYPINIYFYLFGHQLAAGGSISLGVKSMCTANRLV